MEIRLGGLEDPQVIALLDEHLRSMAPTAPATSRHALDLSGLQGPSISFWCLWDGVDLAGFGALKELGPDWAEIKSMRTAQPFLRKGVASVILRHLIDESVRRGYTRLYLETGSMDFFAPARQMYAAYGFVECTAFGSYRPDPNSIFMCKSL